MALNLFGGKKDPGAEDNSKLADSIVRDFKLREVCPDPPRALGKGELALETNVAQLVDNVERLISEPGFDLPMLPTIALKLMELLQNPDVAPRQIGEMVLSDPVLAAKFLRMSNSAMWGGKVKIENVHTAVMRLGLGTIKNVVMAIALNGTVFKDKRLEKHAKKFWEHSIGCAAAAQGLAPIVGATMEGAFLAGLLHDIGKIPALLVVQKAVAQIKTTEPIRPEFVEGLIEAHHVRCGFALLKHWTLPTDARLAVGAHHAVNSMEQARAQVLIRMPESMPADRSQLALNLACVVLADKALGAIGWAEEPGDLKILGATDLGLNEIGAMEFLMALGDILGEIISAL